MKKDNYKIALEALTDQIRQYRTALRSLKSTIGIQSGLISEERAKNKQLTSDLKDIKELYHNSQEQMTRLKKEATTSEGDHKYSAEEIKEICETWPAGRERLEKAGIFPDEWDSDDINFFNTVINFKPEKQNEER